LAFAHGVQSVSAPVSLAAPPSAALQISILHVPDCPSIGRVRETLQMVLRRVGATAIVQEVEGEYPSPTLLIDGVTVAGYPLGSVPACRIHLPTYEEIAIAIRSALARRTNETQGNRDSI